MNYSDEIAKLAKLAALQRDSGKVDPVTEEIIEGLLTVVKSLSSDYAELNERLRQNEEISESLSMDIFDIQSLVLKQTNADTNGDLTGVDLAQFFAQMNQEDDDDEDEHNHCDCGCDHEHHHHNHVDEDYDEEDGDEGSTFVRCPFCNTLIFGDTSANKFQCPFCGGSFTRDDII